MPGDSLEFASKAADATEKILKGIDASSCLSSASLLFKGRVPALSTRHQIVAAQAAAVASVAVLVADRWRHAGGPKQQVVIEALQAACSLNPANFQTQHGYPISPSILIQELKAGFYRTADDRWFFPCGSYPHLRDGTLELLGCANTSSAMARAIAGWSSDELETAFVEHRLTGAYARTASEWLAHPQGLALSAEPVISIEKISDTEPEPASPQLRPLDDLRVLDMAHVIAGPLVSRTLAEHGADVLRICRPDRPDPLSLIIDTCVGKRSSYLDFTRPGDGERLQALISESDVFVQSFRPDALESVGFGPAEMAQLRPGLIYVSVSCFGFEGPWAGRKGFEYLAQAVSGISIAEGTEGQPKLVPSHLLNDYMTGYLAAAGVLAALRRRAVEGGSFHVKVSLARTSMWIQALGLQDRPAGTEEFAELKPLMESRNSPFGILKQLPPVAQFSHTPAHWSLPPSPLGSHAPVW